MLNRREILTTLASLGVAAFGAPFVSRGRHRLFAASQKRYSTRAVDLVQRATVIDMLSPLTLDFPKFGRWMTDPDAFTAADLQPFRDSGINVFHIAVGTGGPNAHSQTLQFISAWNSFLANQDQAFLRIDSAADLRSRQGGAAQSASCSGSRTPNISGPPTTWTCSTALGQRVSQLTYNSRNLIGNGSTERRDEGICDFGVAIIERMNKVGMAVDVSHCGDRTTLDAFEVSQEAGAHHALELPGAGAGASALQDRRSHQEGRQGRRRHGHHRRADVRQGRGADDDRGLARSLSTTS